MYQRVFYIMTKLFKQSCACNEKKNIAETAIKYYVNNKVLNEKRY